jgi:hypothetical protein
MKNIKNKNPSQSFRFWKEFMAGPVLKLSILAFGLMLAGCDLGGEGVGNSRNENGNGNNNTSGLAAPSGVTASALSSTEILVSWYSVSGAYAYNVYWAESAAGPYDFDGSTTAGVTSFISSDWLPGGTGYFKVTAVNSAGESAMSSYAYATTPSSRPGSSPSNAIQLSSSQIWTSGTLNSGSPAVWYTFYISNGSETYCLSGWDRYAGSGSYTSDVSFEIYDSGLNLIRTIDAGNGSTYSNTIGTNGNDYQKGTWTTGTWYVKVVPYNGQTSSYGTYAIYFF